MEVGIGYYATYISLWGGYNYVCPLAEINEKAHLALEGRRGEGRGRGRDVNLSFQNVT